MIIWCKRCETAAVREACLKTPQLCGSCTRQRYSYERTYFAPRPDPVERALASLSKLSEWIDWYIPKPEYNTVDLVALNYERWRRKLSF